MKPNLSLKTWPDVTEFDNLIHGALLILSLSNLEREYTETNDGKDTWTIRDPEARQDIICIIVDGDLNLHIETLEPSPILDWLSEQLTVAFQGLETVLVKDKITPSNYLNWSMKTRSIGPTLEMAKKQLERERKRSKWPSLAPAYSN